MLVLTRKRNEMIHIGDAIVIKVISTSRGKVKLGIDAPRHIRVLRSELAKPGRESDRDASSRKLAVPS